MVSERGSPNDRTPRIRASKGTTATVAVLAADGRLVVANVGDSRAVACCDARGRAVRASVDHVASDAAEAARVAALGGAVVTGPGGVARVAGDVVVTRSIGNVDLAPYLSAEPNVVAFDLRDDARLEFMVLATDGLWDVISSDDAVRFVRARLDRRSDHSFQAAATALTHEALVRQSTDNVGVCVVDLQGRVS